MYYDMYYGGLAQWSPECDFPQGGIATYIGQRANQYRIKVCTYIGHDADLYSFAR